jgi:hypothetical protein
VDKLPLTQIPQDLAKAGFVPPSYRQLWTAVVDGALADHVELKHGRWYAEPDAIPGIAKALGLPRRTAA